MPSKTIEPSGFATDGDLAAWLLTPEAVRARCADILRAADRGALEHFELRREQLRPCADFVVGTIQNAYPAMIIPFHARWRHFVVGRDDRWAKQLDRQSWEGLEQARVAFDLAVTSVLLDAGSGPQWRYVDATGTELKRSEGLAIASLEAFLAGRFSSVAGQPCRADANGLMALTSEDLGAAFQVSADNPLAGLDGRVNLMRSLGRTLAAKPEIFGAEGRIGNLADDFASSLAKLEARDILIKILTALGDIWPGRSELAGINLGDTWSHSAVEAADGFVPFHKLSQWLSYSLIEPLQHCGVRVRNIGGLTGLAEYRNGGLLIDMGVLAPKDAKTLARLHAPGDELIVEWRALTVGLLDELAALVCEALGLSAEEFPLAKVLEGGTWAAGRRIAAEKREGGGPPINIVSDGSVF